MTSDVAEFVVVWREAEGAAVRTFAHPDKTPRVFNDVLAQEAEGADVVDDETFAELLDNREEFQPKRVSTGAARNLLGWSV